MFKPKFQIITDKDEIDSSAFLWRYIDVHEFLAFSRNKSFVFTRLDQFNDPLESASIDELQTFYLPYVSSKDINDKKLNKDIPADTLERFKGHRDRPLDQIPDSLHKRQKSRFASCWYLNKHESHAMWNLYSNPGSVVVKFKPSSLIELIEHHSAIKNNSINQGFIKAGAIIYEDYLSFDFYSRQADWEDEFLSYVKDSSYSHEKEYRFIFFPSQQIEIERIELSFENIPTHGFEVVAHPRMPDWKRENLESYCNELNIKFTRSNLLVKM